MKRFISTLMAVIMAMILMSPAALMEDEPILTAEEQIPAPEDAQVAIAPDPDDTPAADTAPDATEPQAEEIAPAADSSQADGEQATAIVESQSETDEAIFAEAVDAVLQETSCDLEDDSLPELAEASFSGESGGLNIDEAFTNEVFREWVRSHLNTDDNLDYLSTEEICAATDIDLSDVENKDQIDTLEGAKNLYRLQTLNISGCTALRELPDELTGLTGLNASGCTSLAYVPNVFKNLTQLDVSGCTAIESIPYMYNNPVTIKAQGCTSIKGSTFSHSIIEDLDISGCTGILELEFINCSISTVNTDGCSALESVEIRSCPALTTLNVGMFPTATEVRLSENAALAELNFDGCPNLDTLRIYGSDALTRLDVSKCARLKDLYVSECSGLIDLDTSGCTDLTILMIYKCGALSGLNVDNNRQIERLYCDDSGLEKLDVSGLSKLIWLSCSNNRLTSLDVRKNTALVFLECDNNALSALDVTMLPELIQLGVSNNALTTLDLSRNTKLEQLTCYKNKLTTVDVSKCALLVKMIETTKPFTDDEYPGITCYSYENEETDEYFHMWYDEGTTIITREAKPDPVTEAPAATVTTTDAPIIPTIAATKKNSKVTLTAAPGTTAQLDLAGATGKKFKSSNKKVATVNSAGLVTLKKQGKTTISFKVGKKTRKVRLTFRDSTIPKSIVFAPVASTDVKKGDTVRLTPVIPDGTNSGFKWKSSNKKVAKVSSDGTVTFKKSGKVTITCTAKRGGRKTSIRFKVSNP